MESKTFSISMAKNPSISIKVIPGHFATSNAHTNYYLDVNDLKSNSTVARDVAREIALPYLSSTLVDTIVCMERTEVIGAYLAEELLQYGATSINGGNEIHIVAPLHSINGKLIFQDNVKNWILNKNIILLVASVSSGRTLSAAIELLSYYGGNLVGVSVLFQVLRENPEHEMNSLFTSQDVPGYKIFDIAQCEMCKGGQRLNAIVNSEGYTKI